MNTLNEKINILYIYHIIIVNIQIFNITIIVKI